MRACLPGSPWSVLYPVPGCDVCVRRTSPRTRQPQHDRVPGLPAAGRLARGGGPGQAPRVRRPDLLGTAGAGLRRRRTRASSSSGWPRRRTARTGPGATSPVTGPATGSTPRSTATGLANQPTSVSIDDGLTLFGTRVVAAVRCAPPDNKPTPARARHLPQLARPRARTLLAVRPRRGGARRVRLGGAVAGAAGGRDRRRRGPSRSSGTGSRSSWRTDARCSAAIT